MNRLESVTRSLMIGAMQMLLAAFCRDAGTIQTIQSWVEAVVGGIRRTSQARHPGAPY